ncbi:MAG TPA: hypothetical protein VGA13_10665 [Acidimicrobiales bacterium]
MTDAAGLHTDGKTIFVPGKDRPDSVLLTVLIQAGLLGAGSLGDTMVGELSRPRTARRYLSIEGRRVAELLREDLPGLARHLEALDLAPSGSTDPSDSLCQARSRAPVPDPAPVLGDLRLDLLRRCDNGDSEPDARTPLDPPVTALLSDLADLEATTDDGEEEDPTDHRWRPTAQRALKRLVSSVRRFRGRSRGALSHADPSAGGEARPTLSGSSHRTARRPGEARAPDALSGEPPIGAVDGSDGETYPEWDAARGIYQPDRCTVRVVDQMTADVTGSFAAPTTDPALKRMLAPLGLRRCPQRRQAGGDDIDIDAAVEMLLEHQAGCVSEHRPYIESRPSRPDLAALVLLDVSGSAADPSPAGWTIHEHQRDAAIRIVATLAGLGDRCAAYGFLSDGPREVYLLALKRFTESWGAAPLERFASLKPQGFTRLGAAVRCATTILARDGHAQHRLLIVISDGLAYDHGYEGAYASGDTRRALSEARWQGIGCLCLSVGSASPTRQLRDVFGSAAYASASNWPDLRAPMARMLRSAVGSSEQHRVLRQRRRRLHPATVERSS